MFSQSLRSIMTDHNMTQKQLSEELTRTLEPLHVRYSPATVCFWLSDKRAPGIERMIWLYEHAEKGSVAWQVALAAIDEDVERRR